jgi:hypothetical protein
MPSVLKESLAAVLLIASTAAALLIAFLWWHDRRSLSTLTHTSIISAGNDSGFQKVELESGQGQVAIYRWRLLTDDKFFLGTWERNDPTLTTTWMYKIPAFRFDYTAKMFRGRRIGFRRTDSPEIGITGWIIESPCWVLLAATSCPLMFWLLRAALRTRHRHRSRIGFPVIRAA